MIAIYKGGNTMNLKYDITVTYSPIGFNQPQVETIPKVDTHRIDEVSGMLYIDLNPTTTVAIPIARIQKIEVRG